MLGIAELFLPGARHTEEERQRLDHTRVLDGDHGRGRGPVDLDSGHIVILAQPDGADAVLPPKPRVRVRDAADEEPEDPDGPDA